MLFRFVALFVVCCVAVGFGVGCFVVYLAWFTTLYGWFVALVSCGWRFASLLLINSVVAFVVT